MHSTLLTISIVAALGEPELQNERFELPPGFHIYKAATAELSGRSYDLATDGDGRLLVGDGEHIRRLTDSDSDGVFDQAEVIAGGLGSRGPQGLLVYGDRVYAVGGDGLQLFTGYLAGGALEHQGRIGEPFHTGGDHSAHMIFRGHDNYLYFITGDGGGTKDRVHITESNSPVLFERKCSVFRISPDGSRWECVGSGGRNSPNVGMNYLGDLFSLDSDMEWHVDMPWWRPVRVHHWIAGGDQGWQGVGAYPPYYVDNLAGILDVGRGSPTWGQFYEHEQFPSTYRDAYLVCDYPWKSATSGRYATGGQVYALSLTRSGATWRAEKSVLVRPRPGARNDEGQELRFAVVDLEVARDGSLFISEHGQGVWRLVYAPDGRLTHPRAATRPEATTATSPQEAVAALLQLVQPQSEWSRRAEEQLRTRAAGELLPTLRRLALSEDAPLEKRLRAVRLLTADFRALPTSFLAQLARARPWELRAQAGWLVGLRTVPTELDIALRLLDDDDPFVRRRGCEALLRNGSVDAVPALLRRLEDEDRRVRYTAMIALSHRAPEAWFSEALQKDGLQPRVRALVARHLARKPPEADQLQDAVTRLLRDASSRAARGALNTEDHLDVLRVLGIYRDILIDEAAARDRIALFLRTHFPNDQEDLHREGARLLGDYRLASAFRPLLEALLQAQDPVLQFHIAQSLARLPAGWSASEEERATEWFLGTQSGWFAEFEGKGRQFPHFWRTVLADYCRWHADAVVARLDDVRLDSLIAQPALEAVAATPRGHHRLAELYRREASPVARRAIVRAGLGAAAGPEFGPFLRSAYLEATDTALRGALLTAIANRPKRHESDLPLLEEGLSHEQSDVVRACSTALRKHPSAPDAARLATVVGLLEQRERLLDSYEQLLVAWTDTKRPDPRPAGEKGSRPAPEAHRAAVDFWQGWYVRRFGQPASGVVVLAEERSDENLQRFLKALDWTSGNPERGRAVYDAVRCSSCHGGGSAGSKLFGPDLGGVTQRLSRDEIIDSLVFPSKRVEDRFKGVVAQLRGGLPVAGFLTAEDQESITLATQETVQRISREDLLFLAPQETSLMPERLLNRLPDADLADLMAYLASARSTDKR